MRLIAVSLLLFAILLCIPTTAQTPRPQSQDTASSASTAIQYTLPPDKLAKARALYLQVTRLTFIDTAYGLAVILAILYLGIAARFRDFAERVTSRKWLQGLIVLPLFIILLSVLTVPSDLYHQHIRREYGLSVQSWASWWGDWGKTLLLTVVIETVLVLLLYAMIRRSPRRWWFYGWLLCVPVVIFVIFISPLLIEPMFFKFTPLQQKNPELVTQIERVVHRGGLDIPPSRIYEMNAGTKYTGDNAYVTGFGASKRVVVWDTTEKHLTNPEIMFVFGHEMGHYVLGHIVQGLLFTLAMMLLLFYLAYLSAGWMLRRWGIRWQIRSIGDWASVPLIALLLTFFFFISSPIGNGFSRHLERQADAYGLEVTRGLVPNSQLVAAQAFQKLGENWLEYPYVSDFYEWWAWDHPTTSKRIRQISAGKS